MVTKYIVRRDNHDGSHSWIGEHWIGQSEIVWDRKHAKEFTNTHEAEAARNRRMIPQRWEILPVTSK